MAEANLEIVRSVIPDAGDLAKLLAADDLPAAGAAVGFDPTVVAEDAEVVFMASWPGAPTTRYRGLVGLVEGWRDWVEPYESYALEVEELIDCGDRVLSLVNVAAVTSRDGVPITHRPAALWTVREGRIRRVAFYLERDQALAAAGLG